MNRNDFRDWLSAVTNVPTDYEWVAQKSPEEQFCEEHNISMLNDHDMVIKTSDGQIVIIEKDNLTHNLIFFNNSLEFRMYCKGMKIDKEKYDKILQELDC